MEGGERAIQAARPDTAGAQKLAPVPAPPLAAAADKLPADKLKAPKGFKVEVYASGMPNARSLAVGDKGTVFVGSRLQDAGFGDESFDLVTLFHVMEHVTDPRSVLSEVRRVLRPDGRYERVPAEPGGESFNSQLYFINAPESV